MNYSSTGNLSDPKIKKIKSNISEKESTLKQIWKKKSSNENHVDNKQHAGANTLPNFFCAIRDCVEKQTSALQKTDNLDHASASTFRSLWLLHENGNEEQQLQISTTVTVVVLRGAWP